MALTPEDLAGIQEKMNNDQRELDQLREARVTTDEELDQLKQRAAQQKAREGALVTSLADGAKQLAVHYGEYAPRKKYQRKSKPTSDATEED